MKCFARDKNGKVFEIELYDPNPEYGVRVTCEDATQAEEMFKQLEAAFPAGKGLLEMLIDEPFED